MSQVVFAFDPRLDAGLLHDFYEGDKEHASMVFENFLQSIGNQLDDLEENFKSGNYEIFRQQVHKIKPVFSFIGLPALTEEAELLENECKQHLGSESIKPLYNSLRDHIVEFIPVIENELVKLKQ